MSFLPAARLEADPARTAMRLEHRAVLDAYEALLDSPAFMHKVDLVVLSKIAADENTPVRERRRAAEVLANVRLRIMEAYASVTGLRERMLDDMGIAPSPTAGGTNVAVTQVNTVKIEVVRDDDWRTGS